MAIFWVVALCSLAEGNQRFRGPCCLHHQGDKSLIALMMEAVRTSETLVHGATTQKTAIFVLTTMRTSNPTDFEGFVILIETLSQEVLCRTVIRNSKSGHKFRCEAFATDCTVEKVFRISIRLSGVR
jgi:hypothetical protein